MRLSIHEVVGSFYKMAKVCFDVICILPSSHKYEQIKKRRKAFPIRYYNVQLSRRKNRPNTQQHRLAHIFILSSLFFPELFIQVIKVRYF